MVLDIRRSLARSAERARPSNTAPVSMVIWSWAMIVPLKTEVVPRLHWLPTCQKTLAAWAPPGQDDLAAGGCGECGGDLERIKTPFEFPWASKVRLPDDIMEGTG